MDLVNVSNATQINCDVQGEVCAAAARSLTRRRSVPMTIGKSQERISCSRSRSRDGVELQPVPGIARELGAGDL